MQMKGDHMKREEIKKRIPYLIVVGPQHEIAVYNRKYELIKDDYSLVITRAAIASFARSNPTQSNHGFDLSYSNQRPRWMTDKKTSDESEMLFIYLDSMEDHVLDHIRRQWAEIVRPYKGHYFGEGIFGA
jgi:hypothetical protein